MAGSVDLRSLATRFARNGAMLAAVFVQAGCGRDSPSAENRTAATTSPVPASLPAKPFVVEEKTDRYEFEFSWPAEAAAIPELVQRFQAEMNKARAEVVGSAEEERARREQEGIDYHPFMSATAYQTAGQSPRLLSLRIETSGYEGGAHGNFGIGSLLWDRRTKREIRFTDLFVEPANRDRLLTQRWCDALNKARADKRGEMVNGTGLFNDCPNLDEIAIIPADSDRDGRFDRLMLVASPYLAGPWVEGAYEIELVVTADLISGFKSEFRSSFAA